MVKYFNRSKDTRFIDPAHQNHISKSENFSNGTIPSVETIRKELAEEFDVRSERARKKYNPTLSYRTFGEVRCMVIVPKEPSTEDVLLHLYGGGFISGSPEIELPIAAFLSEICNIQVVLPYYSKAPEHPYPIALNEVVSVYEALVQKTTSRILISGESSGGGLAISMQSILREKRLPKPLGLCLFSPWVDLTDKGLSQNASVDDPKTDINFLKTSIHSYCKGTDREIPSARYSDNLQELPSTYISTGTRDIMLLSLVDFADHLKKLSVDLQMEIWPDMWHVFELYDELPETNQALHKAALFINSSLTVP